MSRNFYRTIIQIEVLSEEPYDPETLKQVHNDITDGDCSGSWSIASSVCLNRHQMEQHLIEQGSDPFFLMGEEYTKLTNDGYELDDGGFLEFPDECGVIRRRDCHGNCEEIRLPEEDGWMEWRDLFPFDAVYFQPEQAGDLDTGLSSSQILSSHVYKDFNIAKKYHPDCVIEVYRNDDIGEPYFVDNPVPRMS